jgi:lipopolysaccharide transport system ATP-binding protein
VSSVCAKDLGKAYRIYTKPVDSLKELFSRKTYHETFWALQDVDLEVPSGGALGVIGENGAGKTTLLQLLAGTMKPTCGTLQRSGRVSAILELGSGFHDELSGLDNIRIGCSVLGLPPAETERRVPEIIAFSELESVIHRPVKTYSSGMYVRLAFAVATSVDPDILVIDEALSVGDLHFQKKCVDRMTAFREQSKALIFCSHSLYLIRHVCEQCLWLRNGRPAMLGPTPEVTEHYQDHIRARDGETPPESTVLSATDTKRDVEEDTPTGDSRIHDVALIGECPNGPVRTGGTLMLRVVVTLEPDARGNAHVGLRINRNDGVSCYGVSTEMDSAVLYPLGGSRYGVTFVAEDLPLLAGEYAVDVGLANAVGIPYDRRRAAVDFRVTQGHAREIGMMRIPHRWEHPAGCG